MTDAPIAAGTKEPKIDAVSAVESLRQFHPVGPWLLSNIDAENGSIETRLFRPGQEADACSWVRLKNIATRNIYFSAAIPRADIGNKRAKKDDIASTAWLWCDLDPRPGEDLAQERDRRLRQLTDGLPEGVPQPTAIIDSGGGFQGFWKLDLPHVIDSEAARLEIEDRNRWLQEKFGADSCFSIDHIMRVPSTINWPGAKKKQRGRVPAQARVVAWDADRIYGLADFKRAGPKATNGNGSAGQQQTAARNPAVSLNDLPEEIKKLVVEGAPVGTRSEGLFKAIAAMCRAAWTRDQIVSALRDYPDGIAEKYLGGGKDRIESEVDRVWAKLDDGPLILAPGNPMESARKFVGRCCTDENGTRTLHRHKGAFYRFVGTYYALAEDEEVRTGIWQFLETARKYGDKETLEPFRPKKSHVTEIEAALMAVCALDSTINSPAWLNGERRPAKEFMAVRNGLLHLATGDLLPPTPDFFCLSASEAIFNPDAPKPRKWLAFLNSILEDDKQAKAALCDWFGYCLSADTRQQKILMMVGPKRSGKGTTARTLKQVLGEESVKAPTLSSMSANFGLEPLIGKPLAVISDARLGNRSDHAVIAERLLSISGEDVVTIDRKFRQAWTGTLPTRFMLLTNELPRVDDAAGALASRFIIIVLRKTFYGQEDQTLEPKIMRELSGILNWALAGYRRLAKKGGRFIQPDSAKTAMEQLEILGSPITAFIREKCRLGTGAEFIVVVDHLYLRWSEWCKANGLKPSSNSVFGRDLAAAFPGIRKTRPRDDDDNRVYSYEGVKLVTDEPAAEPPSGPGWSGRS